MLLKLSTRFYFEAHGFISKLIKKKKKTLLKLFSVPSAIYESKRTSAKFLLFSHSRRAGPCFLYGSNLYTRSSNHLVPDTTGIQVFKELRRKDPCSPLRATRGTIFSYLSGLLRYLIVSCSGHF